MKVADAPNYKNINQTINNSVILLPPIYEKKKEISNERKTSIDLIKTDDVFIDMINNKVDEIKKEYYYNLPIKAKANNIIEEKQLLDTNQKILFSMVSKMSHSIPPNISNPITFIYIHS